uniref:Uncharacterized protein n=1 Tax=Eutreptiella gymnastica TaxID=73025 RepID=A0A7S4GKX9_9EUGL
MPSCPTCQPMKRDVFPARPEIVAWSHAAECLGSFIEFHMAPRTPPSGEGQHVYDKSGGRGRLLICHAPGMSASASLPHSFGAHLSLETLGSSHFPSVGLFRSFLAANCPLASIPGMASGWEVVSTNDVGRITHRWCAAAIVRCASLLRRCYPPVGVAAVFLATAFSFVLLLQY